MKRTLLVTFIVGLGVVHSGGAAPPPVSFNDHIRPILADRCFACHGPDSAARKADLRLDREEFAKAALPNGVVPIVPGKLEQSAVIHRLTTDDPDEVMPPPDSKLSLLPEEIELIRRWIAEGARWENHWAFLPPVRSAPPLGSSSPWPHNEIDQFILARLGNEGLQPSPPADPAHLLRRLTFDLTGLPPTLAELDAFLRDPSEDSYERAVDRLLSSPAFGERLALEWLDVARYGDTDGLFEDHPRSIYAWRDWVVSAFNENLPYSEFITWQLAGDLVPDASNQQKIATGFLRNNPTSNEGGIIDEDYRIKYLVDRVNTTSTAFLGLTMECAQCHDHKFDPMTQREYYQFAGFFNSLVGNGNTKGATAPTLEMCEPEDKERLGEIANELQHVADALESTPPDLEADFEAWLKELARPVEWIEVDPISDSRPKSEAQSGTEKEPFPPSKVRGRFIRISLPEGHIGFLTLSEVEVYANGHNVARSGKASQSSDYGNAPAAKAIDGNADGSFGSCSCTTEQKEAWWEVDLGADVAIDQVVIYNRNDCCPERLDNVLVEVLDADRKGVETKRLGPAPFRTVIELNPHAPPPKSAAETYAVEFDAATLPAALAAMQLSSAEPGVVTALEAEILGEKPRKLALQQNTDIKVGSHLPGHVVGISAPLTLKSGERLKLTLTSAVSVEIGFTTDPNALVRTTLPPARAERLAHFRTNWPGFAEARATREALIKEKNEIEKRAVVTMIAGDLPEPRPTFILERGEYDKPGERINPAAPESIFPFNDELPPNRLGLARWIVDPANPLTARVAVNRYWQMIFGTGLVETSEDFGTQGSRPTHPALLNYLAVDFVESGWDLKRLLRKMVMSAAYRQTSARSASLSAADPPNRFLARASRQRLPAEFIRDHALAVSGLLVEKRGGPGVHPYQPAVLFGRNAVGAAGASFTPSSGPGLYRRSLYTYWKRQIPAANMRILGADGRTACRTRREKTNTPLQALVLLNDPQFVEAARVLAERVIKEAGPGTRDRLAHAFRLVTSRTPSRSELAVLHAEFNDRLEEFTRNPARADAYLAGGGASVPDPSLDPARLAAFAAVASLVLNLDESISKS